MSSVRYDQSFYRDQKVFAALCREGLGLAGPAAIGLYVILSTWALDHDVEVIRPAFVNYFAGKRHGQRLADILEEAGLFQPVEGGWTIVEPDPAQPECRPKIPDDIREVVYTRDGYACLHCGTSEDLSLDHVHPRSRGGSDHVDNLQTLCRPCNSRKGVRV